MHDLIENTRRRFAALLDGSAWLLILPALLGLFAWDAPMARTLLQWSLFFVVLSGFAVMISRIVFPQINLSEYLVRAYHGDLACAIVAAAVVAFVAFLILSFVLWARPLG